MSPGAVGDVGGRQIDHQKTAVGVDRDVALATHDPLARIVSPCFSFWSFDRLAVDNASGWACFASHALSVEHQRDVVDRLKQEPTDKSAKPPIDRLPRREIIRQHPPSPARTGHVADCVQHLPQIDLDRSPSRRCAGKKGLNPRPFLVGQVARIPFGLLLDLGHSAARCWGPHPKLKSRPQTAFNDFSNGLSGRKLRLSGAQNHRRFGLIGGPSGGCRLIMAFSSRCPLRDPWRSSSLVGPTELIGAAVHVGRLAR